MKAAFVYVPPLTGRLGAGMNRTPGCPGALGSRVGCCWWRTCPVTPSAIRDLAQQDHPHLHTELWLHKITLRVAAWFDVKFEVHHRLQDRPSVATAGATTKVGTLLAERR
jgi:hypothetical protein